VYVYFCKQYWKWVSMYFYLQSAPIYFLLAICPHLFCIGGNLSPYIFYWQFVPYIVYWQSVPKYFLGARYPHIFFILRIFLIVKHSSHTALEDFFLLFLPFLFSLFLLQARHGRLRRYSSIFLSSVTEDPSNASNSLLLSELLTI
jgi:hypothetical protein